MKKQLSRLKQIYKIRKKKWLPGFDETGSIFIHIPKAAGTSISDALYGEDPWHYPARDYLPLGRRKLARYFKFAFVRNPYERILSAYHYSFIQVQRRPGTSVTFVTKYPTFSEFVLDWINEENINNHHFFQTQYDYVSDPSNGQMLVDFIGRMETLQEDFEFIKRRLGIDRTLPHKNPSSSNTKIAQSYTADAAERIATVYKIDFDVFHYPTEIPGLTQT